MQMLVYVYVSMSLEVKIKLGVQPQSGLKGMCGTQILPFKQLIILFVCVYFICLRANIHPKVR